MDRETSSRASGLLYTINDLSQSADNALELLNEIKAGEAMAKFIVHGRNGTSTSELSQKMGEKICEEILNNYYGLIRETKDKLNDVIESAIPNEAVVC